MRLSTLTLAALAASPALAETIYSVLVFTRHGDRALLTPGPQVLKNEAQPLMTSPRNCKILQGLPPDQPGRDPNVRIRRILPQPIPLRQLTHSNPQHLIRP